MSAANPLVRASAHETAHVLGTLTADKLHILNSGFTFWALAGQEPPRATASGADWRTWVVMAGRGFGKTRAGAEWVLGVARGDSVASPLQGRGGGGARPRKSKRRFSIDGPHPNPSPEEEGLSKVRIALVAATVEEARAVMVEGPSGILASARPGEIREWSPARRTIIFESGAQAFLYSGASPESLRGPEHDFAWCDELAKWRHPQGSWDNLSFGLRRGRWPRAVVTTTPQSGTVLSAILDLPDTVQTGGSTRANVYLPQAYVAAVEARYAGTRLGAQELDGVLLRDVEGSLWPGDLIARCRVPPVNSVRPGLVEGLSFSGNAGAEEGQGFDRLSLSGSVLPLSCFTRIVVGVDPPASVNGTCGIVVCALDRDEKAYVLDDASVAGVSPEGWARAVVAAADRWGADRVVAERNQGGDMVTSVLRAAPSTLPVRTVTASRGKAARAEPVAALFENGQAVFAGAFPALEAELGGLQVGGGYRGPARSTGPASPDRADAMVWALWALKLAPQPPVPRIHGFN